MAMSVGRRIAWAVAALLGPLLAAAVAAPYLVNVEAYKPALIQAVKEATGRELVIDGPMRLRMFPVPRVSAQRVHFANAPGAEGAQMVDVRWIGASPSWWALLRGNVEIGRLTLYQPTIVLETDADGVPNWQFKPGAGASQAEGAPAEGFHLAIGELRIVQGTLSYTNPQTRQTIKAEQVEATAQVRSLQGPLAISGKATVNGVPLSLDVGMSERKADGHDLAFALQVLSGKLDFKGRISELDASAELKGHLAVTTGVLTDFIAAMVRAGGQASPTFDASVVGRFTFDGGIELTPTRLAVTDFKMTMGAETASGTLAFEQSATPSLKGRVALPKIDLEKWLALLASPGAFQPAQPAGKAPAPPKPASLSPFPAAMDVSLALDVAEVVYRKGTVRDLAVAVEIHKGVITVPQLKAVLPGDMRVQATVQANGELSVTGPRLRETLAWLEIDPSGVPSDKLQRLDLKGKLAATGNSVQIADLVAELDGQRATGSGSVTFATPLAVAATLQADRFDLDGYLPAEPAVAPSAPLTPLVGNAATPSAATAPVAIATLIPAAPPPPDPATPVFALKAKVAKLVFRKQTLGGIEGDASVQGNLLKVNAFKIADLLGAKADLKGTVTDFATAPRYDLTFNATLPDADKVHRLCRPAETPQRQDRCGFGQRRRRRHDERAGAAQRQCDDAGQHGARHRCAGARQQLPLRLPDLQSADAGCRPAGGRRDGPAARRHRRHLGGRRLQGRWPARGLRRQPHGAGHGDDRSCRCHPGRAAQHQRQSQGARHARPRRLAGRVAGPAGGGERLGARAGSRERRARRPASRSISPPCAPSTPR